MKFILARDHSLINELLFMRIRLISENLQITIIYEQFILSEFAITALTYVTQS